MIKIGTMALDLPDKIQDSKGAQKPIHAYWVSYLQFLL